MNHDCRPNAGYFIDDQTLIQHVYAADYIPPGTELTISYINPLKTRFDRQKVLSRSWGFMCTCSLCSLPADLAKASDERVSEIRTLTRQLEEDWVSSSFSMVKALMDLYKQERLQSRSSEGYWYAAMLRCEEGDRWDAIRYGHAGIELGLMERGSGDERVRMLRRLTYEPEAQPCWGKRLKRSG